MQAAVMKISLSHSVQKCRRGIPAIDNRVYTAEDLMLFKRQCRKQRDPHPWISRVDLH